MATTTAQGVAPMSLAQAMATARQAAEERGFAPDEAESTPNALAFKKGMTFTSWGAHLAIGFAQTSPSSTNVVITVKEAWAITDWGRGKKVAAALLAALGAS